MLDIVVAHYNSREFEECLKPFFQHTTIVYDKSGTYPSAIPLKNEGRESDTYLHHIIENYDTLNDYTLFIQDDTDNHIQYNYQFYYKTKEVMEKNIPFFQYETTWRKNGAIAKRLIHDGYLNLHTLPSPTSIKEFCTEFGIVLAKSYTTELCAFFIASREILQKRPREFYVALREWLLKDPKRGFVMEHVWKLIFS